MLAVLILTWHVGAATAVASDREELQSAPTFTSADDRDRADIVGAFADSLKLLLIEHGTRIALQPKTRRELGGPFWRDYQDSIRMPRQWEDTDAWWVNYIGHPIHGAAAGYIWLDHERGAPLTITTDSRYWASRGRAMAWAASYSLQFEIGPLSEASIGNVGMRPDTTGWVDHVVTPLGAFGGSSPRTRWISIWSAGSRPGCTTGPPAPPCASQRIQAGHWPIRAAVGCRGTAPAVR